jgi:hypothetical protein
MLLAQSNELWYGNNRRDEVERSCTWKQKLAIGSKATCIMGYMEPYKP